MMPDDGVVLPTGFIGVITAEGVVAMLVAGMIVDMLVFSQTATGMIVALAVLQPNLLPWCTCSVCTAVVYLHCFYLRGVLALFFVYCIVLLFLLYS